MNHNSRDFLIEKRNNLNHLLFLFYFISIKKSLLRGFNENAQLRISARISQWRLFARQDTTRIFHEIDWIRKLAVDWDVIITQHINPSLIASAIDLHWVCYHIHGHCSYVSYKYSHTMSKMYGSTQTSIVNILSPPLHHKHMTNLGNTP